MMKTRWGVGLTGAIVLGVIGILGVSASGHVPFGLAGVARVQPESTPAWVTRVALVDEAIGRADRLATWSTSHHDCSRSRPAARS